MNIILNLGFILADNTAVITSIYPHYSHLCGDNEDPIYQTSA